MSNRAISTELIELGERIRKRRQEMKLSQESFAEKAGISANTVSRIEEMHTDHWTGKSVSDLCDRKGRSIGSEDTLWLGNLV